MPKKNDSITLHQKHGLNPTLPVCFYCGKEKNEIALLGAGYDDEAPMHMILNLDPCPECERRYDGYTLVLAAFPLFHDDGVKRADAKLAKKFARRLEHDSTVDRNYNYMRVDNHAVFINHKTSATRPFIAVRGVLRRELLPGIPEDKMPKIAFAKISEILALQDAAKKNGVEPREQ